MTINQKPTALIFGGGGAKGAFQIGAWQALEEAGMLRNITAVAGCSVGALNAVLFALGDHALARKIWLEIQPSDLLAKGAEGAFFSREGLVRMLEHIPLQRVSESPMQLFVSVQHAETKQPVFFQLNGLPADHIRTLLLASSAIPHIYPPERYLGADYLDGSMTPEGSLCISPLYARGYREILMVSLKTQLTLYGASSTKTGNLTDDYPDAHISLIKPLRPMGNLLTGTLNFAHDKIQARMDQGYTDTKSTLGGLGFTPQTKEEINAVLTEKMEKLFFTGAQLNDFITANQAVFAPNIQMPTLGGNVWYDNIFEVDGWRLQQHRTVGMQVHYRILNPAGVRVAWIMQPEKLLQALLRLEADIESGNA